jgi:geranylgeranyl pyrophosphate synthase
VEQSLDAACALEMVHAFSLVHDDLPALDDDDMRRGRETVHVRYGEAMAVLVGDALLNMAFQTIAMGNGPAGAGCLAELARATNAMIGGQVLDTLGGFDEGLDIEARVRQVHENKTGALLRAACRMGAVVACEGEEGDPRVRSLTRYGAAIGLMFQVVDDLLDVEQSSEHLGKRAGKDAHAGKLTYPNAVGVEGSRAEISRLGEIARDAVRRLGDRGEGLRELIGYLERRTR